MSKAYLPYFRMRVQQLPQLSRRAFLRGLSALGLAPVLSACSTSDSATGSAPPANGSGRFEHGVASGDPYPDSVVLWTRVTPDTDAPVTVQWSIARDAAMQDVLISGHYTTDASRDYTVKVVPTGLTPQTYYWYQFSVGNVGSTIARTKTAPAITDRLDQLKFAFTSCAYYSMGYFNAYRHIADRDDLDVVFTLGDYIYEYGGDEPLATPLVPDRYMEPAHEILTLEDYRTRHRLYKTDADLQAAHAQHPWICTWDDHESANNSYTTGADDHTEGEEGLWSERKQASIQAYFEWMPVRDEFNPNTSPRTHLYRRMRYADLVEFFVLDTRLEGRDPQAADKAEAEQPGRYIMSPTQEAWLLDGLRTTPARWKVIAQQTMMSQLYVLPQTPFGYDAWDGYVDQRNRLFDAFGGDDINNVVVITGDIHTAFACELTRDPSDFAAYTPEDSGAVGVEFVCPSVTTQGFPPAVVEAMRLYNRQIRFAEGALGINHGYVVVEVTPERCEGSWYFSNVLLRGDFERKGAVWGVNNGEPRLSRGSLL